MDDFFSEAKMRSARINLINLGYEIYKRVHCMTTLVLLPGMNGTGELFVPLLKTIGASIETVVINHPLTVPLSYSELEPVVRPQLPRGPFILLGESFSRPIVISIAATQPKNLKGLVLSCAFASSPRPLARLALPLLSLP
jgi:pimeloyl-[acyl-carrier protein] methyl ester esterase